MSLSLTPVTLQATAQPAIVSTPKPAAGIKAIPNDILGRVLSFLPAHEKTLVRLVCKDWRNLSLVNDDCLDLSELPNLSDSDLKTILDNASGTRITSINLSSCNKITDAGLAHLSKLTLLSSLNLSWCNKITDAGLAHLSKLTLLSSLNLSWCDKITDAGLAQLSKAGIKAIPNDVLGHVLSFLPAHEKTLVRRVCKDWRNLPLVNDGCLDLSGLPDLSDSGLKTILDQASDTHITSINLSNCKKITSAGLAHLSKLTSLRKLNLFCCTNITDAGLAHLETLTLLSSLNLEMCANITDDGLAHLSKLTSLIILGLRGCRNITDAGLAHLSKLTSLSRLILGGCRNITDAGLAHLSKIPLLSLLDLRVRNITDVGLAHLSKLTSLSKLTLGRCTNITDAGLAHLSKLPLLSVLDLRRCTNITDAGLAHLSKLPLLSILDLRWCTNITDAALAYLITFTSLPLVLLDDSRITSDAVKAFEAKLITVAFKDAAFRNRMDYYIYMLAPQPKGGDEWGKQNRYVDLDRLKLAQALVALESSHPEFFKELSIASLLDLINQPSSTDQLDQSLHKLPEETRNAIYDQVYQLAPEPKEGSDQWGEKHCFDDLAQFRLAVIDVIKSRVRLAKE